MSVCTDQSKACQLTVWPSVHSKNFSIASFGATLNVVGIKLYVECVYVYWEW